MLLVGVIRGPYALDFMCTEMMAVSGDFRKTALIVILLGAGFNSAAINWPGLDAPQFL